MPKALPYLVMLAIMALLIPLIGKLGGDWIIGPALFVLVSPLLLLAYLEDRKVKPTSARTVAPIAQVPTQLDGLRDDVKAALAAVRQLATQNQVAQPTETEDLKGAVSTLAQELGAREKESRRLIDLLIQRDQKRILARLASIRETAEFTRRIAANGKLDEKEALNQLTLEIEDAFNDLGLEIMQVPPGTKISELPAAAFTAISAEEPPHADFAGTVKESLCDAVFVTDEAGRRAFIAPAKLKLYKL